jgi:hypothetical protein
MEATIKFNTKSILISQIQVEYDSESGDLRNCPDNDSLGKPSSCRKPILQLA